MIRFKYKRKKNNNLIMFLIIMIVMLSTISIGYALFTDTIHINGSANIALNLYSCSITISGSVYNDSDASKTITVTYVPGGIPPSNCIYEYSLDGGATWNIYSAPFKIYSTTTIKARCTVSSSGAEIGSAEKEVRIAVVQLPQYNGNNTVLGFTGLTKSNIKYIKRASDSTITLEDIQTRINNGENIQKLDDGSGTSDLAVYGWYDGSETFYWWSNAETIYFNSSQTGAFRELTNVESIDLIGLDTSKVTTFNSWFWNDKKLKTIDLSGFDTSKVNNLYGMFYECNSLQSIDVSKFDTSQVTNFASMFGRTYALTELDLSSFNTSKATNMNNMFNLATGLTSLKITSFDTSRVTAMSRMFASCESLETLDITSFNTSRVTDMTKMFSNSYNLKTIYASDSFVTDQATNTNSMFIEDTQLVGGNGTAYDANKVDKEYARIDTADTPGYFTSLSNSGTQNSVSPQSNFSMPLMQNNLEPENIMNNEENNTQEEQEEELEEVVETEISNEVE